MLPVPVPVPVPVHSLTDENAVMRKATMLMMVTAADQKTKSQQVLDLNLAYVQKDMDGVGAGETTMVGEFWPPSTGTTGVVEETGTSSVAR